MCDYQTFAVPTITERDVLPRTTVRLSKATCSACIGLTLAVFIALAVSRLGRPVNQRETTEAWTPARIDKIKAQPVAAGTGGMEQRASQQQTQGIILRPERMVGENSEGAAGRPCERRVQNGWSNSTLPLAFGHRELQYFRAGDHDKDQNRWTTNRYAQMHHYSQGARRTHAGSDDGGHAWKRRDARCHSLCSFYKFAAFNVCVSLCRANLFPPEAWSHAVLDANRKWSLLTTASNMRCMLASCMYSKRYQLSNKAIKHLKLNVCPCSAFLAACLGYSTITVRRWDIMSWAWCLLSNTCIACTRGETNWTVLLTSWFIKH